MFLDLPTILVITGVEMNLRAMKSIHILFLSVAALIFAHLTIADTANAQLRDQVPGVQIYESVVGHTDNGSMFADWLRNMNMTMSHSYSMSFGSVNGRFQNLNAYTNTLQMRFSENLSGQVALSFLHSPFGAPALGMQPGFQSGMQSGTGNRIIVDHARLDYKLGENTSIRFEFSQRPYYGGFGGYGGYGSASPFSPYRRSMVGF